jgi:SAM-dependent methyltransferase
MLMPDPRTAFAETRRVLRAGGRLSCAVFGAPDVNPWVALPSRVLRERGHMPPTDAGGPGILALSDPDRLRRTVRRCGLLRAADRGGRFTWSFPDVDAYWEFLTDAAGAIAMVVDRLDGRERELVRERIAEGAERFAGAAGIEIPAACLVASAS